MTLNLTDEDKLKLKYEKYICGKYVDLSIGSFYAKYCSEEEMFRELLGKKIADLIGIKCPNYYMFQEEHCILSENLNKNKNFSLASELKKEGIVLTSLNDLREILQYQIEKYNRYTNVDEIMFQMYTVHFMDILFSNTDRHTNNYGFVLNEDNTGFLVIFDQGEILKYRDKATRPLSFDKADVLGHVRYSKEMEFRYFIEHADEDVKKMIDTIISLFSLKNVSVIMDSIERETNYKFKCKKSLLIEYLKNYIMVKKVILLEKSKKELSKINAKNI